MRGTPHNTGKGLEMAFKLGAQRYGLYAGCHATPMDLHTPDYGNLDLPHLERKHYRKICYFLGIMVNANGERFVDEGKDFRNYTYAQFGRSVLEQPNHLAWQIFDAKVDHLLYSEYKFHDAHFVEADTLDGLIAKLYGIEDKARLRATIDAFNAAVNEAVPFDPTRKDGKNTPASSCPSRTGRRQIDTPPFKAYPVTGGITFTYGGLKVSEAGGVVHEDGHDIPGLYACGELVGGVFFNGYPGGSGLTSGAVFGRRAGYGASHGTSRNCRGGYRQMSLSTGSVTLLATTMASAATLALDHSCRPRPRSSAWRSSHPPARAAAGTRPPAPCRRPAGGRPRLGRAGAEHPRRRRHHRPRPVRHQQEGPGQRDPGRRPDHGRRHPHQQVAGDARRRRRRSPGSPASTR